MNTYPAKFLATLINQHYPQNHFPNSLVNEPLISELSSAIEIAFEEKPSAIVPADTFIAIITVINNYQTLNEKNLSLLAEFFAEFPKYLFILSVEHQQNLITQASDQMKQHLKTHLLKAGNTVPGFINQYIEILSVKERTELAEYYLDKFLKLPNYHNDLYFSGDPYLNDADFFCHSIAEVIVDLQDFLDKEKIEIFVNYLIAYLQQGLDVVEKHLEKLFSKLNQSHVSQIIILIANSSLWTVNNPQQIYKLLASFKNCPRAEGTPIIVEKEAIQKIFWILKGKQNSLIIELINHFSDDIKNILIQKFLDNYQFEALAQLFDALTDTQRKAVTVKYLEGLDTNKSGCNDQNDRSNSEAIIIFNEYFDISLICDLMVNILILESETSTQYEISEVRNKILLLSGLIPVHLQQRLVEILLSQLETHRLIIGVRVRLPLIVKNLSAISKKDLPTVFKKLFPYIEANILSLDPDVLSSLKEFASEETYWSNTLTILLGNLSVNVWQSNPSLYRTLYVSVASAAQMDLLIAKLSENFLQKIKSHQTSEKTMSLNEPNEARRSHMLNELPCSTAGITADLREFAELKSNVSIASQRLISELITIFLNQVNFKEDREFKNACNAIKAIYQSISTPYMRDLIINILHPFIMKLKTSENSSYFLMINELLDEIRGDQIDENILADAVTIIKGVIAILGKPTANQSESLKEIYKNPDYLIACHLLIKYLRIGVEKNRIEALNLIFLIMEKDPALPKLFKIDIQALMNEQTLDEHKIVRQHLARALDNPSVTHKGKLLKILNLYLAHTNSVMSLREVAALPAIETSNKKMKFLTSRYSLFVKAAVMDGARLPPDLADIVVRYKFIY